MTKSLTDLLGSVIKQYGLEHAMVRQQMPKIWAEVVGERIAKISTVRSFENGVLRVHVSEPTWRTEVTLRREEIRNKMNTRIGSEEITEIMLK